MRQGNIESVGTTKTLLTFEEFEQLPDRPGKRELLRGELIELPPARYRHNLLAHRIQEAVRAALQAAHSRAEAAEVGEAYHEMGYQLGGHSYVQPDVSVLHADQKVSANDYLQDAPALAIEVISPSNTARQITRKIELYFEFGALEVWVFRPKTRRVAVHTADGARELSTDETLATPLIPGLALSIRELFGEESSDS